MTAPSPAQILATPMQVPGVGTSAETIRDYLLTLLARLWREKERFNSKRPFGNSGWHHDLYVALGHAGHVRATFDEDGYLDECDDSTADRLILSAIEALGVQS